MRTRPLLSWLFACAALCACGRLGFDELGGGAAGDAAGDARIISDAGATGVTMAADHFGGTGNEEGYDIAVASDGKVYVAGTITTGFTLGTSTLTGGGAEDLMIAVFDSNLAPIAARSFGSTADDRGQGIAVDSLGRIYVVGYFTGTVDFGGQSRTAIGMWDLFVASYTPALQLLWVNAVGGAGADFAYDCAIDPAGNLVVAGYYEGTVDFGQGALPAFGVRDVFVAKYAANGTLAWARGYGSAANDSGQGVAATASGNVVAGGSLGGTVDFGGGMIGNANASFVVELDSGGNHQWSRGIDGTMIWDVDVDRSDGRILLGSRVQAGADLGMGALPAPPGGADGLVVAIRGDRQQDWYRAFGGALSDIGLGTAVDAVGNTYSIGLGGADIDFGAGTVTGNGDQDAYITSHDLNGTLRWAKLFGGTIQDRGYAVAVAPDGSIYISGRYANTADFGKGPMPSNGGNDMFLVKLQ